MPSVDDLVVAGYYACRKCGEWTPDGVGRRGYCPDCMKVIGDDARTVELEYEVAGRTVASRPTRGRHRGPDRRDPEQKKRWNKARSRALMRLARIHHPLYEVLLAQEKADLGMDPRLDTRTTGSANLERKIKAG